MMAQSRWSNWLGAVALIFLIIGVCMMIWPDIDLIGDTGSEHRRRSDSDIIRWLRLIDGVWSMTAGIISTLLGLLGLGFACYQGRKAF